MLIAVRTGRSTDSGRLIDVKIMLNYERSKKCDANPLLTPSDEPGRECGDGTRSRSLSVIVAICIRAGAKFLATDFMICALIGRMDRILNQTEC